MRKLIFSLTIILSALSSKGQGDSKSIEGKLNWHTSIPDVYEISKTTGKPIFAFFTGSDWCGWCHKLQREVFAKPAFIDWANRNVILLELDFPRKKQLSAELTQQNAELQQAFRVGSFPTIWIFFLDKDEVSKKINISALGSLGYPPTAEPGKEEVSFLSNASKVLSNRDKTNQP
jgi:protein disulfide-isomerase